MVLDPAAMAQFSPWSWDIDADVIWCLPGLFVMHGQRWPAQAVDQTTAIPVPREQWLEAVPESQRQRVIGFGEAILETGIGGELSYPVTVGDTIRWMLLQAAVGEIERRPRAPRARLRPQRHRRQAPRAPARPHPACPRATGAGARADRGRRRPRGDPDAAVPAHRARVSGRLRRDHAARPGGRRTSYWSGAITLARLQRRGRRAGGDRGQRRVRNRCRHRAGRRDRGRATPTPARPPGSSCSRVSGCVRCGPIRCAASPARCSARSRCTAASRSAPATPRSA